MSNFPRSLPLIEKENLSITVRMQMSVVEIKQICVFTTSKCDLVIPRRSFSRFQFDEFVYEKVCALLNATSLWMQISAFGNFWAKRVPATLSKKDLCQRTTWHPITMHLTCNAVITGAIEKSWCFDGLYAKIEAERVYALTIRCVYM